MARPRKKFDWDVLNAILQYNAELKDCAELLNVSEDTVERRIKEKFKMRFAEYRDKKMGRVRVKLVETAIKQAMSGNATMMIFCLKNLCKWKDRPEPEIKDEDNNINLNITVEK